MGCCGQHRRQYGGTAPTQRRPARAAAVATRRRPKRSEHAYFQYLGKSALTATGPISGRRYRFDRPGAVVAVDPRGRRSLAAVPTLTQVAGP